MGATASLAAALQPVVLAVAREYSARPQPPPRSVATLAAREGVTVEALLERAQRELNLDLRYDNWVVCGPTGAGRSTLIRAYLGLGPDRDGRGPSLGTGKETTCELESYDFVLRNCKLWDVPGAEAEKFPEATYFADIKLYAFNTVVFVCEYQLPDLLLRQVFENCNERGARMCILVNKVDMLLQDIIDNEGLSRDEEALARLRSLVEQNAAAALGYPADPPPLFLVSARLFAATGQPHYDEVRLLEYLLQQPGQDVLPRGAARAGPAANMVAGSGEVALG